MSFFIAEVGQAYALLGDDEALVAAALAFQQAPIAGRAFIFQMRL